MWCKSLALYEASGGQGLSGCRGGQVDGEIVAGLSDRFQRHVLGSLERPFALLLDQDGADQEGDGVLVKKNANNVGWSLDLAMQAFERVCLE